MNKDEEADADDLASEFETDRTRKKIRRNLVSHFSFIFIGFALENNLPWDFFIKGNLQEAYWSKYCWLILDKFYKSRN